MTVSVACFLLLILVQCGFLASDAFTISTTTIKGIESLSPHHQQQQRMDRNGIWASVLQGEGDRCCTLYAATSESSDMTGTTTATPITKKKSKMELEMEMSQYIATLNTAATTKQVDSDEVYNALVQLEQCARQCNKLVSDDDKQQQPTYAYGQGIVDQLTGSWQLVFTTGTVKTQERLQGAKINYFPIKAVQTFNTTSNVITNAIYIGDFIVLQFRGYFTFDIRKCKLEFDFTNIQLFQLFNIELQKGQAAEMGAATGLGSESNIKNIKSNNKRAFFNWISADHTIATARGGGGGLALWKRI